MKSDKQISLRLPQSFVNRAKKLANKLKDHPQYRVVPRLGMSFVLKLAIDRGLELLEKEQGDSGKRRR